MPFHDLAELDYRNIIKTFQSVFPHTTLWFTGGSHSFLVATPTPLAREDILALQAQIDATGVADDLESAQRVAADYLMDEQQVRQYTAQARIVSDDNAFFLPALDMDRILTSFEAYLPLTQTKVK